MFDHIKMHACVCVQFMYAFLSFTHQPNTQYDAMLDLMDEAVRHQFLADRATMEANTAALRVKRRLSESWKSGVLQRSTQIKR